MKFFPESALVQLEYEKIKTLLAEYGRTEYAKAKAADLRIHTKKEFIETELRQGYEYKLIIHNISIVSFPRAEGPPIYRSLGCRCGFLARCRRYYNIYLGGRVFGWVGGSVVLGQKCHF